MIVGLVGFIGAGKGSVADILVERHDYIKESFANSVKDSVSAVFGWDRSLLEGDTPDSRAWREQPDRFWSEKLGKPFSPRLALQLMGTEAGRDVFHQDLWIYTVERRCDPNKDYVIPDVRFPNEIESIQRMGGKIVRVHRGAEPIWWGEALSSNRQKDYNLMKQNYPEVHYSEWAWIGCNYDCSITNNHSLEELVIVVDTLAKNLYNNVHVDANEELNYETF